MRLPPVTQVAAGFRAAPDLQAAIGQWLSWLAHERRVAELTVAAYGRDVGQFLAFLSRPMNISRPRSHRAILSCPLAIATS